MTTGRSSDPQDTVLRNNMLSIYIAPAVYDRDGAIAREIARFVAWVKASPPAVQGQPVLMPGEVERTTRARRTGEGIAIDDQTWADIRDAAQSVGIAAARVEAIVA